MDDGNFWTMAEAVELVTKIEHFCPDAGCHIALTGGTLYKKGLRKDIDILFYRIRQVPHIDLVLLVKLLDERLGIKITDEYGWLFKATYKGKGIDIMFPESDSNAPYVSVRESKAIVAAELNQTAQNAVDGMMVI